MKRDRWVWTCSLLVGLLAANLFFSSHFFRWDLTEKNEYTLSKSTREILKDLDDLVNVRVYFSENLPPQLMQLRRDVSDLLGEFRTYAGKNLRIEYHNPDADPVAEQKVQMMGIPPLNVSIVQKDKQELTKIYLGMAVQFGDRQEVLPVVQATGNLEYELASALVKVTQKEKPVLGWFATEGVKETSALQQALGERYRLENFTTEKPEELDVTKIPATLLLVADSLSEGWVATLKNYLQKGGKLIVLASPIGVGQGLSAEPKDLNINSVTGEYGIEVNKDLVLDQSSAMATFTGGIVTYHIPYPYWPKVIRESLDHANPITAELESLVLPWTSSLKIDTDVAKKVTVLAKTTNFGVAKPAEGALSLDPMQVRQEVGGAGNTYSLIAEAKGQLIVVGNARITEEQFLKQFPENGIFLENAIDSFAYGEKLIGIRSKGPSARPIAVISDQAKMVLRTLNVLLPPVTLVGLGFLIYGVRKKHHRALALSF